MKALMAIQAELKCPKNLTNTFGNYKYRNAEGIFEAVKPLLAKHGCSLTASDEIVCIGAHNYVKATVTLSDGTESISVTANAREPEMKKGMDDSQITGAASSYARKYALNGLLAIDDTKDADSMDNRHEGKTAVEIEREFLACRTLEILHDVSEDNRPFIKRLKAAEQDKLRGLYRDITEKMKGVAA